MKTLSRDAPAKINLYLNVISKRSDGFHNIETVMQSVSLTDSVLLEFGSYKGDYFKSNVNLPDDDSNLCRRAVNAFYSAFECKRETVGISLHKRIPMGAGLGGGSSDAAAVLQIMNEYYGFPFPLSELCSIASGIGSDVPFCILSGSAIAEGRGELLTPLDSSMRLHYVICKPNVFISTPAMYRRLDEIGLSSDSGILNVCSAIRNSDYKLLSGSLYNAFEQPAFLFSSEIETAKQSLLSAGATNALMTGSGSAVFGLFPDKASAESAYRHLRPFYKELFICETYENSPLE